MEAQVRSDTHYERHLSQAPVPLKVHALIVGATLAAMLLVVRVDWNVAVNVALVVVILLYLLKGARLAWWSQTIGIPLGIGALAKTHYVLTTGPDLSMFVSRDLSWGMGIALAVAWVLLMLPASRSYVFDAPPAPRRAGTLGFVVAILIVSGIPKTAFGMEDVFPSRDTMNRVRDATFLGGEDGVAYFARQQGDELCFMSIHHSGSSSSCTNRVSMKNSPGYSRSGNELSDIIDKDVMRVEVVSEGHPPQEATVIANPRFFANFYYLVNGPDFLEPVEIVGYDALGSVAFRVRS